jgi:hypothetical protein
MAIQRLILLALALMLTAGAAAADESNKMQVDTKQVRVWNKFANDLIAFHISRLTGRNIVTTSKMGGYMRMPDYYEEVEYHDKDRGVLLSRIRYVGKSREKIHVIEVFVHDDKKRVIRDYTAGFLPGYRNAPNQTLISLHHYARNLHAFRSFDASGVPVYEGCTGTIKNGTTININLEDYQIEDVLRDQTGMLAPAGYAECFGTLPDKGDAYVVPK